MYDTEFSLSNHDLATFYSLSLSLTRVRKLALLFSFKLRKWRRHSLRRYITLPSFSDSRSFVFGSLVEGRNSKRDGKRGERKFEERGR